MPAIQQSTLSDIEKAKGRLLYKHMFFALAILGTPMVSSHKFPRAATNMVSIYLNPDFIATLTVPLIMFVIAHEVFHILLKHGLRRGGRDPDLWNVACDYYINWKLMEYGFEIWKHCLIDKRFAGMYEEQIFEILVKENKQDKDIGLIPKHGGGNGSDPGLTGDLTEYGVDMSDPAVRTKIEQAIENTITKSSVAARAAGKMPAGLELLFEGLINPPQPWFSMLVQFMTRFVATEETWARRNRRVLNYVLPSRRNPGMGGIGIIGDTSGSMLHYEVYPQVGEEMNVMMNDAKPEFIQVIWADHADASMEERFHPGEQIVLHPRGGGGTDMRLPLKKMEEYEVDVCVLITDAETPWPDQPTPFPLIILTTTNEKTPPWSHTIRIR